MGLASPEQNLCTAQGHNVDCYTKPSHVCDSGTQQGFPNQVRNAKAPYPPEKYIIFDIHCWRSRRLLLQAVKLDPEHIKYLEYRAALHVATGGQDAALADHETVHTYAPYDTGMHPTVQP